MTVQSSLLVFLSELKDPAIKQRVLDNLETKEQKEMGFSLCQVLFKFDQDIATIQLYNKKQQYHTMDITLTALKQMVEKQ